MGPPPGPRQIMRAASIEVDLLPWWWKLEPADCCSICAFCLITSAGVRMVHEASSAPAEASAWTKASGTLEGSAEPRADLADSYVRKKAPAVEYHQAILSVRPKFRQRTGCSLEVNAVEYLDLLLTCRQGCKNDTPNSLIQASKQRLRGRLGRLGLGKDILVVLTLVTGLDSVQGVDEEVNREGCQSACLRKVWCV